MEADETVRLIGKVEDDRMEGIGPELMYQIILKKRAKKYIDRLPMNERKRIVAAIERSPDGDDIKKLKGYITLF